MYFYNLDRGHELWCAQTYSTTQEICFCFVIQALRSRACESCSPPPLVLLFRDAEVQGENWKKNAWRSHEETDKNIGSVIFTSTVTNWPADITLCLSFHHVICVGHHKYFCVRAYEYAVHCEVDMWQIDVMKHSVTHCALSELLKEIWNTELF